MGSSTKKPPGRPLIYTGACKREGCKRKPYARGLCNTHYEVWRRKFPAALVHNGDSQAAILNALPATRIKIAKKVELSDNRVVVIIRQLRAAGEVFIKNFVPPEGYRGGPWKPVYARGNKDDAVLEPEAVREHALAMRRSQHAADAERRARRRRDARNRTQNIAAGLIYADVFNLTGRRRVTF